MSNKVKYKYLVSVIMPVYNVYDYVETSIQSLLNQTLDFSKNIELVLINDGSTDNSDEICKKYQSMYPDNVKYIVQENSGAVTARNNGIRNSSGKYLCFLDSDDTLNEVALEKLTSFFDKHYDEVDLVEYKIIPVKNGVKSKNLHYRYDYLTDNGVYDLENNNNIFASVTTINYMVKNLGNKTHLFDNNILNHEDQKYSMDVIRSKMKIGYVDEAEYLYLQRPNSVTQSYFHAYYLFDATTKFWEDTFTSFNEKVPRYYQALFLNDIIWKNNKDILKPYQYEGKKYEQEFGRILKLLNMCDDYVIMNHPLIDSYYKMYYLNLKNSTKLTPIEGDNTSNIGILNNNQLVYASSNAEVHFLTMKIIDDKIKIRAYIKSPIFILVDKPELYLYISNKRVNKKIELRDSSFDYLKGKEKFTKTYLFEIDLSIKDSPKIEFKVKTGSSLLDTKFYFEDKTIFSDDLLRYEYHRYGYKYITDGNAIYISKASKKETNKYNKCLEIKYFINDKKRWLTRLIAKMFYIKKEVWLYYDCKGVKKDNGYYQFIHDLEKTDGVKRYFVTTHNKNDIKELFNRKQRKHLIKFNSIKHKFYYLYANKVITAYVEQNNCSPYTKKSFLNYIDISKNPEIIYLQHGVLHAHMPWKYSIDRLLIDKEVVSTSFEKNNLMKNYSFAKHNLIESGMPRYDYVDQDKKAKNVILFAPSWRNYLIGKQGNEWVDNDELFLNSSFYKETQKFLNSPELKKLLKKYNYILDFKLHPIFKRYEHHYKIDNDNVILGTGNYNNDDYKVFITDYSSFVFDFVYLKRAIVYFFPDYDMFKAGLNIYREIDLPFEEGFGEFCETSDKLLNRLEIILKNNGFDEKKYQMRSKDFFLYYDNNQCDRIYDEIIKKD